LAPADLIASHENETVIVAKLAGILLALTKLQDGKLFPFRVFNLV
jgi:hypothetical protein